uniref:Uncharacterized protein n=1 Tax=Craspedostauros australis TaxID=1486917 RepID=A0A7S0F5Y9_9STRA|mmetsp:Transcript_7491/g.20238  ORF Transcript_7491/g.20238 Transcript_7491/m.20238 type:complete len:137 (+) Transcript_7491:1-411(+)
MNPMLQKVRLWNEHFVLPKEKQYCRGVIEYANQKFHISSQSLALTAPTSASSIPSLSSMEKDTRSSLLASLAPSSRSLGSGVTRSLDNCHASSATDCDVFAAAHKHHLDEVGYGKNYMEEARLRHKLKRSRDQKRY